eukprot:4019541-Alexandrium_andersonii.AAC.1
MVAERAPPRLLPAKNSPTRAERRCPTWTGHTSAQPLLRAHPWARPTPRASGSDLDAVRARESARPPNRPARSSAQDSAELAASISLASHHRPGAGRSEGTSVRPGQAEPGRRRGPRSPPRGGPQPGQ